MSDTEYQTDNGRQTKPEFLKIKEAAKVFSIGKNSLYELIRAGKIKSVLLRKRGNIRGTRLLSYDSLLNYLNSLSDEAGK